MQGGGVTLTQSSELTSNANQESITDVRQGLLLTMLPQAFGCFDLSPLSFHALNQCTSIGEDNNSCNGTVTAMSYCNLHATSSTNDSTQCPFNKIDTRTDSSIGRHTDPTRRGHSHTAE